MTCPNPKCASSIPDDSIFCDQCGKELFRCSKCGALATGKFCAKDGARTTPLSSALPAEPPQTIAASDPSRSRPVEAPPPQEQQGGASTTVRIPIAQVTPPSVKLIHAGGSVLSCPAGTILGRKAGPHSAYLVAYDTISGQHGKIRHENSIWMYVDTGSTNGSRVNGKACVPQTSYPIKTGDVIELASQKFQVE